MNSIFRCRACNGSSTTLLLDLGELPLVGAFVSDESSVEDRFTPSLTLVLCDACSLIQIREAIPRELLFSSYLWVSGTSATATRYGKWLAEWLRVRYGRAASRPFLVEIASNDGFMLRNYREAGFDILGVDPSNLADEADKAGLPSIRDFFGAAVADRILATRGPADVIVARNVLGHASELQDLVAGIKKLLSPTGSLLVEMPYALLMRDEVQYDQIMHEHLSYFTVRSLANLMAQFGLRICDATFVRMNGGSMLCEIRHDDSAASSTVQPLLDLEDLTDLNCAEGWGRFAAAVVRQRSEFRALLESLSTQGRRVAAYGAAGKCMTMLNYCGVSRTQVAAIGDANPRKQGLLCPGVRIPVVSPQQLASMDPEYVVIGAGNFKDEIMRFFKERLGYRNQFIVPIPLPQVLS